MWSINFYKFTILITSALLLIGCSSQYTISPPPIFTAYPLEEETGHFTEKEADECISPFVEFVAQEEDLFLFYVEVENTLEDTIAVHPAEIFLEVVKARDNLNNDVAMRYFAIDPEREIAEVNRMIKEEETRHSGATAENIILGVFSVIADFASDIENKEAAVISGVFNTGVNQANEEAFHSDVEKELAEIKSFLENDVLNKFIVEPGETVGGLVYLPFSKRAEVFKVVIPLCERPHSLLFKQVQIN
ncbi:MAG: hypothetical protein JSW63_12610 [Ignavibacterium sp.]|nr:MAG: hypothetical protein JSW63_12610 [Ignavibacterium sp.]